MVLAAALDQARLVNERSQQLIMQQNERMEQMMVMLASQAQQSQPSQPAQQHSQAQQHSPAPQHSQPASTSSLQAHPGEPQILTNNTKIATLHAHNWESWRLEFEALLEMCGLSHAIYPTPTAQPSHRASQLARSVLLQNVEQSLRPMVLEGNPSAHTAYQRLQQHFSKQLRFQVPVLEHQLRTLQLQSGESMAAYLQRSRNLRRDLLSAGRPELADSVASHMLNALPDSKYGMVKEHCWLNNIRELEEIASFLQLKEQRLQLSAQQQRQPLSPVAVAAPARASGRGSSTRGRGSSGRGRSNSSAAGQRTTPNTAAASRITPQQVAAAPKQQGVNGVFKPGVMCLHPGCGHEGHYHSMCPLRQQQQSGQQLQKQQPAGTMSAIIQGAQLALLPVPPTTDLWRVDSGAGRHITPFRSVFTQYEPLHNACVRTAGSQTLPAVAHGTVELMHESADGLFVLQLHDVWHVPDASAQLFSPIAAKAYGLCTHFEPLAVWLQGACSGIYMEAHLEESGLYAIQAEPRAAQPAVAALELEPVDAPQEPEEEAELSPEQEENGHGHEGVCLEQEDAPRASLEQEDGGVSLEQEENARLSLEQEENAPRVGVGGDECLEQGESRPDLIAARRPTGKGAQELEDVMLLHRRMGHLGANKLVALPKMVKGVRVTHG